MDSGYSHPLMPGANKILPSGPIPVKKLARPNPPVSLSAPSLGDYRRQGLLKAEFLDFDKEHLHQLIYAVIWGAQCEHILV